MNAVQIFFFVTVRKAVRPLTVNLETSSLLIIAAVFVTFGRIRHVTAFGACR